MKVVMVSTHFLLSRSLVAPLCNSVRAAYHTHVTWRRHGAQAGHVAQDGALVALCSTLQSEKAEQPAIAFAAGFRRLA
jgi:hypothetical protein